MWLFWSLYWMLPVFSEVSLLWSEHEWPLSTLCEHWGCFILSLSIASLPGLTNSLYAFSLLIKNLRGTLVRFLELFLSVWASPFSLHLASGSRYILLKFKFLSSQPARDWYVQCCRLQAASRQEPRAMLGLTSVVLLGICLLSQCLNAVELIMVAEE